MVTHAPSGVLKQRRGNRAPARSNADARRHAAVTNGCSWCGLALGLINIYATLYPWTTLSDRAVGVLLCVLVAAIGARITVLALRVQLDWLLVALFSLLVAALAVALTLTTGNAPPSQPSDSRASAGSTLNFSNGSGSLNCPALPAVVTRDHRCGPGAHTGYATL